MTKQDVKCARKLCQTRSIETKQAIIAAGTKLFAEFGYHKINTKDIAKEAGVSIGSFYGYYEDKKQLLIEIMIIYKAAILESSTCSSKDNSCAYPPETILSYFIDKRLEVSEAYPLAFIMELKHLCFRDPDIKMVFDQYYEQELEIFTHFLDTFKTQLAISDLSVAAEIIYQINDNMLTAYLSENNSEKRMQLVEAYKSIIARYLFKPNTLYDKL